MTDIADSTEVPLRNVLAKIAIREQDNRELRNSLKQLHDTMVIFGRRLRSCPWPQIVICPGKPRDADVDRIGADAEKVDVPVNDNSIDNVVARLAALEKDHQELKSSVQKFKDIVNAFEGELDKMPCDRIQICLSAPEDTDSKVDEIPASNNVSIHDAVSRVVVLEEFNKELKESVQDLQRWVNTFRLRLDTTIRPHE